MIYSSVEGNRRASSAGTFASVSYSACERFVFSWATRAGFFELACALRLRTCTANDVDVPGRLFRGGPDSTSASTSYLHAGTFGRKPRCAR